MFVSRHAITWKNAMRRSLALSVLLPLLTASGCDSTSGPQTGVAATTPIAPVSAYAEDAVAPIELSGHFTAVSGTPTYAATSSAPDVATVAVADGRLTVRPRNPGTARITVTANGSSGASATQTFTVVTLDPCGTASDLFPAGAETVWTFDWTIQRSGTDGSAQTFNNPLTWRFAAPTCQRGTRAATFTQTSGAVQSLPAGTVTQTGASVTLTYATVNRSITRAFTLDMTGMQSVPNICSYDGPDESCNALTLQAGRGVVGVQYLTQTRVSSRVYTDRGVFTRTN